MQPANRAEATTASYHQGGFAAHVPGCGGTATRLDRGSGEGSMETVMPIEYEVERDIVEYMGAHYGVEPDEITDESTLSDLGLDSLGVLSSRPSSGTNTAFRSTTNESGWFGQSPTSRVSSS